MDLNSVPQVACSGTPEQIGLAHGKAARDRIHLSISNYSKLFVELAHVTWENARKRAGAFLEPLQNSVPEVVEEMRGIAIGAEVDFLDIVVLNLRSEIALATTSDTTDGCTAIAQVSGDGSGAVFVAQNWDWVGEAMHAMVLMDIQRPGTPRIRIFGEAGIVGKFGFNDAGVGICMNAIRAEGLAVSKLPVHIAMRKVLECSSFEEAVELLNRRGLASAVNFIVADSKGKIGSIECSPVGNVVIAPKEGTVCHTNHLYAPELTAKVKESTTENSFSRLTRIVELSRTSNPSFKSIRTYLSDTDGAPTSICRSCPPSSMRAGRMETLATIIIDLRSLTAEISLGQPVLNPPVKKLSFE